MEPTAAEIRRQRFEQVRRGFDPQEVGVFLERVAEMITARDKDIAAQRDEIQRLERELDEAKAAEEAVRLTMVAATKAKDEILTGAGEDAERILEEAKADAETAVAEARRDALALIEESRKDAEEFTAAARLEQAELQAGLETMRNVVKKVGNLLKGMASGALEELGHAESLLDMGDGEVDARDIELLAEDLNARTVEDAGPVDPAEDPVDRLLAQLRRNAG